MIEAVNTMTQKIIKTDEEWQKILSPEKFVVLRKKGTERAFTGSLYNNHEKGVYVCGGCGEEMFKSHTKYDSGSGWPSFWEPISEDKIEESVDKSHGMKRTEIMCAKCGGHLGHVFDDGPRNKTGLRYCVNSASLDFKNHENKIDE